ncbi:MULTISPECIES: hypothetical protein [unclassified Thermosipho (in: thermotogales)]|nr:MULTISPECIES: hypothetical protein [unclassified Thermosipho (in: thermotogales)]
MKSLLRLTEKVTASKKREVRAKYEEKVIAKTGKEMGNFNM